MRRRLVHYFRRKRCLAPDDLADEVLSRVARRLDEQQGQINDANPARYCYIVAKFVFLEHLRQVGTTRAGLAESARTPEPEPPSADELKRLDCLDRCLAQLNATDRELILGYYPADERARIEGRKTLATRFGFTKNALSIRACRIREKLVACVRGCVGGS
jgi:DNA-directed RNA polymerase specialized sigma24 family protein